MNTTYSLLRSKTFWTIVIMAFIGAGNALVPVLPPAYSSLAVILLGALASMFHLSTGQSTSGVN